MTNHFNERKEKKMDTELLKMRQKQLESELSSARDLLGEDAAVALRKYYSLYDDGIYRWFAGLYDAKTGAFYYSNSAKNTDGFLPDLESTRQTIDLVGAIGLMADYENSYYNFLTDEEKAKLASWIQGLQSEADGYFYHLQWGTNITLSRRGRDLIWANAILKSLGEQPYYDTPDGVKGSLTQTEAACCSEPDSTPAPTAKKRLPEHLSSREKWIEYIESFNWESNSYGAGNTLQAQYTQIKAAGEEYVETLMSWLYDHQNPENGLWEKNVSYKSVNGLMKIACLTNNLGYTPRYLKEALSSTLKIALTPDFTPGDEHVCSIYNVWVCMNIVLKSAPDSERDELRKMILDNAADLINVSYEKLSIFKKQDGGFSYFRNNSNEYSQGVRVAVAKTPESDVNATSIACSGARITMMQVLGLKNVRLFTPEDGRCFVEMLREQK